MSGTSQSLDVTPGVSSHVGHGSSIKIKCEPLQHDQQSSPSQKGAGLDGPMPSPSPRRSLSANIERLREAVYVRYLFEDFVLSPSRDTKSGWLAPSAQAVCRSGDRHNAEPRSACGSVCIYGQPPTGTRVADGSPRDLLSEFEGSCVGLDKPRDCYQHTHFDSGPRSGPLRGENS